MAMPFWTVATAMPTEATEPESTPAPELPPPAPAAEIHPKCMNCGATIDVHAEACGICGAPFLTRCKTCSTPVSPKWHVCPECGTSFH